MSGATIVIVAYRPKHGREAELLALTREHLPLLRAEGLATERASIACEAADGAIVEVFEWAPGAQERAHSNPAVQALWERYAEVCEYIPVGTLAESKQLFAGFRPV